MATARPKSTRRRAGAASRPRRPRAPSSAQPSPKSTPSGHGRELAAIACVAVAVFLAFVIYLGWDGGSLGRWVGGAARWLVGVLVYALPLLLCFAAYLLLARRERRPRRGLTLGPRSLVAAFVLAAAADAFGIFTGDRPAALYRDTYMRHTAASPGETLWAVTHPFVGTHRRRRAGARPLLAGALLVTGLVARQWAGHSRRGVAAAGRAARSQAEALGDATPGRGRHARRSSSTRAPRSTARSTCAPVSSPSPSSPGAGVPPPARQPGARPRPASHRRGLHRAGDLRRRPSAPPDDRCRRVAPTSPPPPGTRAPSPASSSRSPTRPAAEPEAQAAALSFHEAEKRRWMLPDAALLQRIGDHTGESPDAIRAVSAASRRDAGALRRHGARSSAPSPARASPATSSSSRPASRSAGGLAQGRPRLRARRHRHPRAGAHPRQDGRGRGGPERPGQLRVARRHPPALPGERLADGVLARQGRLRQGRHGRPRAHGPPARGRHHRLRQERLPQRPHQLDPAARHPGRGAHDHDRPQEGRAQRLRRRAAPAAPVITNPKQATYALDNLTREMDRRYDVLSRNGCQHIRALNKKLAKPARSPCRTSWSSWTSWPTS